MACFFGGVCQFVAGMWGMSHSQTPQLRSADHAIDQRLLAAIHLGQVVSAARCFDGLRLPNVRRRSHIFSFLAFTAYGGFWLAYTPFLLSDFGVSAAYAENPKELHNAIGVLLFAWTILTTIFL